MKPAHVLDDLLDVCRGDRLDLRHVAEFPMMSFDAEFRGPEKGGIAMVIRFINLMDERRTLLCAGRLWSVAGRAMCHKVIEPESLREDVREAGRRLAE